MSINMKRYREDDEYRKQKLEENRKWREKRRILLQEQFEKRYKEPYRENTPSDVKDTPCIVCGELDNACRTRRGLCLDCYCAAVNQISRNMQPGQDAMKIFAALRKDSEEWTALLDAAYVRRLASCRRSQDGHFKNELIRRIQKFHESQTKGAIQP